MDRAIKASLFCQPLMMRSVNTIIETKMTAAPANKKYIALIATAERK
jgi:hypothetical protein